MPLQSGQQTVLFDATGYSSLAVDADNTVYLGGSFGISTLTVGADKPTALKQGSLPVSTLAVSADGTLCFAGLDGVIESLTPGGPAPVPLPFGEIRQRSQIAAGKDGTVYLGDNQNDTLLKLTPGAAEPDELPVEGLSEMGHMVIDGEDNLYVSVRGEISKIAKGATSAEPVAGAPRNTGGLAVDAAGNLYATDIAADTVSRMPARGGDWVQLPFSDLQGPTGITVDGAGNVYVIAAQRFQGPQVVRLSA